MRKLFILALVLASSLLMGQARQARLTTPDNRNDDAATPAVEYRSNKGIEVHLDEDEFNPNPTCNGIDNPYDCCTGNNLGPTCDDEEAFIIYDGSHNRGFSVEECGTEGPTNKVCNADNTIYTVLNVQSAVPNAADCNNAAEAGRVVVVAGSGVASGVDGLYVCLEHTGGVFHWSNNFAH